MSNLARLNSGLQALQSGKPAAAWSAAKAELDRDPADPFALALGAAALSGMGHRAKAADLRRRQAASPWPDFPSAEQLEFMRRLDESVRDRSTTARRYAEEAGRSIKKGNPRRAQHLLERAKELDADCALVHFHRGVLAVVEERPLVARLCFVAALKADAGLAAAREALVRLVRGASGSKIVGLL